jgi:hypothetical protein
VRKLLTLLLVLSLAISAGPILPRAWQGARLLLGPRDTEAVATYQLARVGAGDYAAEVDKALAAGDVDLAASLVELAKRQGIVLAPALLQRVDAAAERSALQTASDAWDGFLSGDAPNESALAGAIAADLTGFGDVRDLYGEARHYQAGEPVDHVTLAFGGVGLTLTAATVITMGGAAPAKAGLSTLKAARRAGKISPALSNHIASVARDAIDDDAMAALGRAARSLDPSGMRVAAQRLVRPGAVDTLRQMGDDVATIGKNGGYRGTLDALSKADDAAGVRIMARFSEKYGRGFRAALLFIGSSALTLASVLLSITGWLLGALLWAGGLFLLILRALWWVAKKFRPASPVNPGGLSAPRTPRGYLEKG